MIKRNVIQSSVLLCAMLALVADGHNGVAVPIDEDISPPLPPTDVGLDFIQAFLKSIAVIVVTELGDKTFFIAAVMAMRHPRLIVYFGALGALAAMTVLSVVIGYALPLLLPKAYTHYASIIMFTFFGLKLLQEARELYSQKEHKKNEELEEVEAELGVRASDNEEEHKLEDIEAGAADSKASSNVEESKTTERKDTSKGGGAMTKLAVFMQSFTLTFFAEWGDRSQIATISLASVNDPFGVTVGSFLGHAACTGLAVIGGRLLATRISERQVALAGGIVFLIFAAHSLYVGP
jgi:putative Ca2+/H+ antiporter (TMEM165/GDT1 family)